MKSPEIPDNEKERLATLQTLKILDSSQEERYDRLTRLAQRLFDVPIVAISLVDEKRQWFKSIQGLDAKETSREISFCGHAINGDDVMVVNDAATDYRFVDNPLVTSAPNIRFYAGCPIEAPNKFKMGTLCLIDQKPRTFTGLELELLQNLGRLVENEMSKESADFSDEVLGISEQRYFMRVLRYVMEFSRSMKFPLGMLVAHVPPAFSIMDKKPIIHDRVIVEVAKLFSKSIRFSDVTGMLGNDSFYIFLPKCDEKGMALVTKRIINNMNEFKSQISCTPDYKLHFKQFLWTPKDPQSIEDLVKKGLEMLDDVRSKNITSALQGTNH